MKKKVLILFIVIISITTVSFAHSGRTDGYGGHYNSSNGTYHYHNGKSGIYTGPLEEGGKLVNNKGNDDDIVVNENDDSKEECKQKQNYIDDLKEVVQQERETISQTNTKLHEMGVNSIDELQEIISRKDTVIYALGGFAIIMIIVYFKLRISLVDDEDNKK